jgi:hypothetical protein
MKTQKSFTNRLLTSLFVFAVISATYQDAAHAKSGASAASSDANVNLRLSALGLLVGMLNVDVDFKISNEWTVGPSISFWNYDYDTTLYSGDKLRVETAVLGVRGTWSKNGAFRTGLYVSPMLKIVAARASGTSKATGASVSGSARGPILVGVVGYQWWFDNFNVNIGGGLAVGASSAKVEVSDGTTSSTAETSRTAGLALDGMIGYTF